MFLNQISPPYIRLVVEYSDYPLGYPAGYMICNFQGFR